MRQNYLLKIISILIFSLIILLFFPAKIFAQIILNEFSSGTTSDWVEIYNQGEPQDISVLKLIDGDGNQLGFPNCLLTKNGTYAINWSNKLNNDGDRISLLENDLIIDCVSYNKGPACGNRPIDLLALSANDFGIRQPEGSGLWVKTSNSTKSNNNDCIAPTSTPIPSMTTFPTPILTPTSTIKSPTPTSVPIATYKINEIKDKDGEILKSVKIYVDNVYLHHYAPEVITFCENCQCDDYVNCDFGQHIIKLEKTGYDNWQETKTISKNDFFEVDPIMIFSQTNESTPTPTEIITPTSIPTLKINQTPVSEKITGVATKSGEILGDSEATPAFYPLLATQDAKISSLSINDSKKSNFWPKLILILSLIFLFSVSLWVWYTFKYTS